MQSVYLNVLLTFMKSIKYDFEKIKY